MKPKKGGKIGLDIYFKEKMEERREFMIPQVCLEMSRDKQEEIHLGEVDLVAVRDLEAFQDSKGSMISSDRVSTPEIFD